VGRIAIVGPSYPFRGGIANFSNHFARGLQNTGHDVHLFTYTVQYPRWLFRRNQLSDEPPPPVPLTRLIHAFNPLTWGPAAQHIAHWRPDLVVYPFWLPLMGFSSSLIAKRLRKLHPSAIHLGLIHNFNPHERRLGDAFFRKSFVEAMDGAFTLSRAVEAAWRAYTPKAVAFFWHPLFPAEVDPQTSREAACARLNLSPEKQYLLFMGLVRPYKGLDMLLRAWAGVLPHITPDWQLIVAGEFYEPEAPYRALVEELRIAERVVWRPGFVPQADFGYYFRAAHALILPYRAATQSGHPFWAYQYECPLLVTRVGGLYEVVEAFGGGIIVEPSVEGLAEGIQKLIQTRREAFQADFVRARNELRWETLAAKLWTWTQEAFAR
jgi:D-inositol-3-phosphate glycosyltransferase